MVFKVVKLSAVLFLVFLNRRLYHFHIKTRN